MREKASRTRDTLEEKGGAPNGQRLSSDPRDTCQSHDPRASPARGGSWVCEGRPLFWYVAQLIITGPCESQSRGIIRSDLRSRDQTENRPVRGELRGLRAGQVDKRKRKLRI